MLSDVLTRSKTDIKIRFNTLYEQFQNNPRYISLRDYTISDDEDIAYELRVNDKRYEAVFYQKPSVTKTTLNYTEEIIRKKPVWFTISEYLGKFDITMYYDNEYNMANGEDL